MATKKDFLENLNKYVDIEQFEKLTNDEYREKYDVLKDFFDTNNLYRRLGLKTNNQGQTVIRLKGEIGTIRTWIRQYIRNQQNDLNTCLEIPLDYITKQGMVVFLYFLFCDNDMLREDVDYQEFYEFLAETFYADTNPGELYDPSRMSEFWKEKTLIMFFVLKWRKKSTDLCRYLSEYETARGDLSAIIEDGNMQMTVGDFLARVDEMCMAVDANHQNEEVVYYTRNSVEIAQKHILNINQLNGEEMLPMPNENENFIEFCKNNEQYKGLIQYSLNTYARRNWYLYRIIQQIVRVQLKQLQQYDLLDDVLKVISRRGITARQRFVEGTFRLWFFSVPISNKRTTLKDGETIEEYLLNECYMNFHDIYLYYELVFDDITYHAYERGKDDGDQYVADMCAGFVPRCIARGLQDEKIIQIAQENDMDVNGEDIRRIRDEMLARNQRVIADDINPNDRGYAPRPGELDHDSSFYSFLKGKKVVSRELLLTFVLYALMYYNSEQDANVLQVSDLDYVYNHIIINSRFDPDKEKEDSIFNQTFKKVFKYLTENIQDNYAVKKDCIGFEFTNMEIAYLEKGKTLFKTIFEGGNL